MKPGLWGKEINGALIAAAVAAQVALQDGRIQPGEWAGIAATLVGVFAAIAVTKNADAGFWSYAKAYAAAGSAFVGALGTALAAGGWPIPADQWVVALVALLNGLPVAATANAQVSEYVPKRALQ